MKSTWILLLTIVSAITAHISTYLDLGIAKYIITAIGAVSAIIGSIFLFHLRKSYSKEFLPKDWISEDESFALNISIKDHRKENPMIACESSDSKSGSWNMVGISKEVDFDGNVIISSNTNPTEFGKFRVRIK